MTAIAQRKELKFVSRSLGRDTITTTTRPLLGVVTRTTIHPNGNTDADYTYTNGGRLYTRTWERGITTTYGYKYGLLASTDYSDSTPDVAITYDSLGRQSIVTQANQSRIETTYDPATLQADQEIVSFDLDHNGIWDFTRTLDRKPTSLGRDAGWQLKNGGTIENEVTYGYHTTTGRLETVANAADTFTYGYTPNSSLIATVTGPAIPSPTLGSPPATCSTSRKTKLATMSYRATTTS